MAGAQVIAVEAKAEPRLLLVQVDGLAQALLQPLVRCAHAF
jgi:hypothetical protein